MRVLYFARFRQLIGRAADDMDVPPGVVTVGDLVAHLAARDAGCAAAFSNLKIVRAAIDQQHAALDAPLGAAREVALFPPVTGG